MDGLDSGGSSDPECGPNFALFFEMLEKVRKKTLHQAHLRLHEHELEHATKRMNSVLGENLEGLHRENKRSAPHSAQKGALQKKAAVELCPGRKP